MKKIFIFWLLFRSVCLFSNDLAGMTYYAGTGDFSPYIIEFVKEQFITKALNPNTREVKETHSNYRIELQNQVPFVLFGEDFLQKWLVLYSDDLALLYDNEGKYEFFFGTTGSGRRTELIMPGKIYNASSFLTEGKIEYLPSSLGSTELKKPWVEGTRKYGRGETIKIVFINFATGLIFSNGFVSFDKPYLYEKNARVKRIKISNDSKDFEIIADILDTPNPQQIKLPKKTRDVVIEILDVYEGTVYEDTCINFILYQF